GAGGVQLRGRARRGGRPPAGCRARRARPAVHSRRRESANAGFPAAAGDSRGTPAAGGSRSTHRWDVVRGPYRPGPGALCGRPRTLSGFSACAGQSIRLVLLVGSCRARTRIPPPSVARNAERRAPLVRRAWSARVEGIQSLVDAAAARGLVANSKPQAALG